MPVRQLGRWPATALVVGHTIGVGVFLTPAALIGAMGSPALTLGVWVVCGAAVFAGALAFGELAVRYPAAGGPYVYLREAWGEQAAFLYGWVCLLIMDPGVTAALAAGVSDYLSAAWPSVEGNRWIAVTVIWVLAVLQIQGMRLGTRVLSALTGLKVIALVLVVTLSFSSSHGSWSHFVPFAWRGPSAVPLAEALALGLVAAFFSFGGFWEASRIAGEVRNPGRTLPRALAAGVAVVAAIYVMTTAAFLYLVPSRAASDPAAFIRLAGVAMLGERGPQLLAVVVLVSVVASLAALLMMAPRLYVAMSRDGVLPRRLLPATTRDSSSLGTLMLAALASVYTLLGSFQQIVAFFFCPTLAFIALAASGLFVLRRREGRALSSSSGSAFRCPGYPWVPASFVLLLVVVAVTVGIARPVQAISGLLIVLAGVPAYRLLDRHGALVRQLPQGAES